MPRYRLTLEYDGRGFVGWQRQKNGLAVQEVIEQAVLDFCGETSPVFSAGRTDSGVHALALTAHLELARDWSASRLRDALNFHLKAHPVAVLSAQPVDDEFHARFSCISRSYLYRILNRRPPPVLDAGRVWWVPTKLDIDAMADAAGCLLGKHDFTTFRAACCQSASPLKTLDRLDVTGHGEEIHVIAEARSFLHHQVRNMVGSLSLIGRGKWTKADLAAALAAKDRNAGGPTAPSEGLYFTAARYPGDETDGHSDGALLKQSD